MMNETGFIEAIRDFLIMVATKPTSSAIRHTSKCILSTVFDRLIATATEIYRYQILVKSSISASLMFGLNLLPMCCV